MPHDDDEPIGVAVNGVMFSNHSVSKVFDDCMGHVDGNGYVQFYLFGFARMRFYFSANTPFYLLAVIICVDVTAITIT